MNPPPPPRTEILDKVQLAFKSNGSNYFYAGDCESGRLDMAPSDSRGISVWCWRRSEACLLHLPPPPS